MDKLFHSTLYWARDYLSMLGLKLRAPLTWRKFLTYWSLNKMVAISININAFSVQTLYFDLIFVLFVLVCSWHCTDDNALLEPTMTQPSDWHLSHQGPPLLTQVNSIPRMHKLLHPNKVGDLITPCNVWWWNYLCIPKLQQLHRGSLRMVKAYTKHFTGYVIIYPFWDFR